MSYFLFFSLVFFCLSCIIAPSHALTNDFSVELIHRDSFKSPLYDPTKTKFQRISNAMHRSINRANYLNQKFSPTKNELASTLTNDGGAGEYLMSYSVGTPPFKVYGFIDTGSNLVWLQCQPCNICYNQTSPIFNPSKSSSYKNIACSSTTCKYEEDISCSNYGEDACEYTYDYGGGYKSQGNLSMETITLDSTSGSIISFPKIMIGCGHTNTLPSYKGHSSGVIGFGSGPMSLIKQLGSSIGEKFSHCLIHEYNSHSNVSSKLNFGDAAIVSGENVVSTPIVKIIGKLKDFYYLTLEAFSVGNKRVKFEGFKREGTNASTQNIIIDSGTTATIFPQHFYTTLESVVAKMVKIDRFQGNTGFYTLCYNTTLKQPNYPVITAHFSGADVKLDSRGTFVPFDEEIECLGFLPSDYGDAIFGNMVQQNLLVGYDLKKNIVSFKPTDCMKYRINSPS